MMPRRFLLCLCGAFALTACASLTSRDEVGETARREAPAPDAWVMAQQAVGDVRVGWIDALRDAVLTQLVRDAQANNKNLQGAAANVEQSWALARQAGAALRPAIDLATDGSRSGVIDSRATDASRVTLGLRVSWELDVWGRILSGQRAAAATAESVEADYRFSQYSLAAAVANAYFLAIEAGLLEDVTRQSIDALTETNRIVAVRYDNGFGSSQDLALAKSDLAAARSALAAAEGARREALRALEVLLGRYPGADLTVRASLPPTPPTPPAGVPSDVLERRPDLVAAERRVAAAFNRLDQANAARLPRISLTGNLGGSSDQLGNLLDPANVAWTVGGNLVAPLLDGGTRRAQVDIATAEQRRAVAEYGQAALNVFQEVETGLDQLVVLRARNAALDEAAGEAREAFRLARLRYDEGETDLLDVLTIQQRTLTAERNLVTIERARLEQWINLNLALGGSWTR